MTKEQRKQQAFEEELAAARERNAKRLKTKQRKPWHQLEFILKVNEPWLQTHKLQA